MEQSLLKLLNEFNSGELRGFDSAYSLEQMESVRDQQEALGTCRKRTRQVLKRVIRSPFSLDFTFLDLLERIVVLLSVWSAMSDF
jgi:hypothetical protein